MWCRPQTAMSRSMSVSISGQEPYITGFTGSAGTAVIAQDDAGLWTDGRYFLQAEAQLQGTGIRLFRMGEPGVPTVEEYIQEHLEKGEKLVI